MTSCFPSFRLAFLLMGVFLICGTVFVSAQPTSTNWTGGGDGVDWDDTANWSTNALPNTTLQTRFLNWTIDGPISINVNSVAPVKNVNFAFTGSNRTVTFNGGPLYLEGDGTIEWNASNTISTTLAITFNSGVNYSSATPGGAATFQVSLSAPLRPITFNGDITTSGTGSRQMSVGGNNVITINGRNEASNLNFAGTGELIAGSTSALGAGWVDKGNNNILSLRSDVTVKGTGADYSWNNSIRTTNLRINELTLKSTDYTLTMDKSITGSTGSFTWVENVNSFGKLILDLKYSGATEQTVNLVTNAFAIVRFSQTGNAVYGTNSASNTYGTISGAGEVQITGTGTTTFHEANTYTGKTTIAAGTLLLAVNSSIANSSEITLGTVGSQGTLNVTSKASFAFGAGQTVSGFGTINIGVGKTVSVAGNLNPGNSPGQVNVTGNLALENTTVTTMELAGDGGVKGTDFDNVTATGSLVYDGTLSIVSFGGFNIYQDGTYSLFDFASQSGNFDAVSFGGDALTYDAGIWSGSSGGYDFNLTLATGDLVVLGVIPEPGTTGLVAVAAVSLLGLRRRGRLSA